ncbi:PTS-dependent dihydroxyacetone kinase, dihydroxyacetone-binding subunit DhaK [subsurface metagenome]
MLDAAVAGNVFASPSPDRILKGIQEAHTGKGVLMIIKNYSGDIMNFEMAKELAEMEGFNIKSVIVKDDVAVPDSTYSTGRRGIAGTIFVHKIAGAKAEEGGTLEEVSIVAQKTSDNTRSMGMAMSSCILPGVGKPGFVLKKNEIEIGMGIHGEPGIQKTNIKTAKEIVEILCHKILNDMDYANSEVAIIVNGLGATPTMELYIIAKEVDELLKMKNINPYKYFVGNFMTSLEMAGCSISLLKLDTELRQLLDAPCNTIGLKVVD